MRGGRCLDAPRAQRTPHVHRDAREFIAIMGRHSHLQIAMLVLMPLVTKAFPGHNWSQALKCRHNWPTGVKPGVGLTGGTCMCNYAMWADHAAPTLAESCKRGLAVIATINPSPVLLTTIGAVQWFYPDFDVLVVDNNSTHQHSLSLLKIAGRMVEVVRSTGQYELGAYSFALEHLGRLVNTYSALLFMQDTTVPCGRMVPGLCSMGLGDAYALRCLRTTWGAGGQLDRMAHVYDRQDGFSGFPVLPMTSVGNRSAKSPLVDACHTVLLATTELAVNIVHSLQQPYDRPMPIPKIKADTWLSERTLAFMIDTFANRSFDMSSFFGKVHGYRGDGGGGYTVRPG